MTLLRSVQRGDGKKFAQIPIVTPRILPKHLKHNLAKIRVMFFKNTSKIWKIYSGLRKILLWISVGSTF